MVATARGLSLGRSESLLEDAAERLDHVLLVGGVEASVERERERARAAVLRDGEHPLAEAVAPCGSLTTYTNQDRT